VEKLRQDVKDLSWYSHAAIAVAALALLIALVGSSTSLYVATKVGDRAADKRAVLHEQDIKSCTSRHRLAHTLIVYLEASNLRSVALLRSPGALRGLSPQVVRNAEQSVLQTRRLLADLRKADCDAKDPQDVIPLNPKEPK
jgi:hypothetical protein